MVDDETTDKGERRAAPRAGIELKVEYQRLNTFFADYTKNLSRNGMFIKTNRPLPVGTEFLLKLLVPQLERPLMIHGVVQWVVGEAEASDASEPGMGIRFAYESGDSQADVARIVEKLMVDSLGRRLTSKLMGPSPEND